MLNKLLQNKTVLIGILAGFVMILGAYFFTRENTTPSKSNPVTLTIWHVYGGQTNSPMNDCIQKFNKTVGKDNGITIKVTSISDSKNIEQALLASFNKEPGSANLPNLFVAYPRFANHLGTENLLPWNEYLPKDAFDNIVKELIDYGTINKKLYVLPIAPSSEMTFVNINMFKQFAESHGLQLADLEKADTFFQTAEAYYTWSNGKQFAAIDDPYNYFYVTTSALGSPFIKDGKLDCSSKEFTQAYLPLAHAAIHGGLSTNKLYASSMRKSGEIVASLSSTAALLYLTDYVTKKNNTREVAEYAFAGYPLPQGSKPTALIRGGGLQAFRDESELKNKAMAIFAQWLTQKEVNNPFVHATGYLPINNDASKDLMNTTGVQSTPRQKQFYKTLEHMLPQSQLVAVPLFKDSNKKQHSFNTTCKQLLAEAHEEYLASDKSETTLTSLATRVQAELCDKFNN